MLKSLRSLLLLAICAALFSPFCMAQAQLAGDWEGSFRTHGREIHFVPHVAVQKDGTLAAMLDVPETHSHGMQASGVSFKDSTLSFAVEATHGSYEGTVNSDATEISGSWTEGDSINLDFKRKPKDAPPAQ